MGQIKLYLGTFCKIAVTLCEERLGVGHPLSVNCRLLLSLFKPSGDVDWRLCKLHIGVQP